MQRSIKDEVKYLEGKMSKNENSMLFARLADAYLQMDRVDEAIALCEKGIKKHPYYVTGHYVLGKCYLRKKLFDQAEKELKRVLLFDPKYIAAHRDYAELMAQIGWLNTSEMSYEEIVRIDPLNQAAKKRLEEIRSNKARVPDVAVGSAEQEIKSMEADLLSELEQEPEPAGAEQVPPKAYGDYYRDQAAEPSFEHELDIEPGSEEEIGFEPPARATSGAGTKEFPSSQKEIPKQQPAPQPKAPTSSGSYFKEDEPIFEEENANLDLLEDIFRDDELTDLLGEDEELMGQFDQPEVDSFGVGFGEADRIEEPRDLGDNGEFESTELDGLADEDVFALMTSDEDRSHRSPKSHLDIEEPSRQFPDEPAPKKELEPKPPAKDEYVSPLKKTLEEIQKQTRPRFEPPAEPPKPAPQQSEEPEPMDKSDSLRRKEKIVTPTLGEIYAAQHQYAKAIGVYEILRKKDPNNEFYKQKIEYLQKKLEESQSE